MDKMPTRKQKCKSCDKEYLVRTHYFTKEKIILTDKEAISYDREKEKYYTDKSFIDGLKWLIEASGQSTDKLIKKTQEDLTKKFDQNASLGDVAWSIANKLIVEAIKKNDIGSLKGIYFQMALYLYYSGKDYRNIKAKLYELDLMDYQKSDVVKKVEVLATNESCEHCKLLNGVKCTIKEAIEKKILPCRECNYQMDKKSVLGWCRCCYALCV
jgi:hypothetical protein